MQSKIDSQCHHVVGRPPKTYKIIMLNFLPNQKGAASIASPYYFSWYLLFCSCVCCVQAHVTLGATKFFKYSHSIQIFENNLSLTNISDGDRVIYFIFILLILVLLNKLILPFSDKPFMHYNFLHLCIMPWPFKLDILLIKRNYPG